MFTFLRKILDRKHFCLPTEDAQNSVDHVHNQSPPIIQMTTDESELDSYESSEIEYDEIIYNPLGKLDDHLDNPHRKYDPIINKINLVSELKKHLLAFRDENLEKKWFLYYALITIEEIGFYPSGMPFSKQEILKFISNYATSLEKEGYPITHYYKLLSGEYSVSSTRFELIARTRVFDDDTFSQEQDENGETLLHHAVRWSNFDLVDLLIPTFNNRSHSEQPVDSIRNLKVSNTCLFNVNEQDFNGQTPIFATTCHKNLEMFKKLVSHGAEINQQLLDKAVNKGNLKMVKWLTSKGGLSLGNRNVLKKLLKN
jgi:hypothetical protein